MVDERAVWDALREVNDPEMNRSLVELKMIRRVEVEGGTIRVTVALTVAGCPMRSAIRQAVEERLRQVPGAEQVIGIEPNREMRDRAAARVEALGLTNVRHRDGLGSETGLPDNCADIVTCSQVLHWMDPGPTFAEVARILRNGGVFAGQVAQRGASGKDERVWSFPERV